ncbi:MAG: DUF805 domain-containing protein [Candidatus Izemoplasma sp.]|nr:DUF805 domain-containing protein [Candidatus Izemoplasma sp.]
MFILESYTKFFTRILDFMGVSSRKEFWPIFLTNALIVTLLRVMSAQVSGVFGTISIVFGLIILIPSITLGIRRLHDIHKSGWNMLLHFIPVFGSIYLIALWAQPGDLSNVDKTLN